MKNIRNFKKYAIILALNVCSIVFAFAQGAVTGYAAGGDWIDKPPHYPTYTTFPTTAQLQRLTHVIASDIGCITHDVTGAYEGLYIDKLPDNWSSDKPSASTWKIANNSTNKNKWLEDLVSRAHAEGVKAILCVGGGDEESYDHWVNATSGSPAQT